MKTYVYHGAALPTGSLRPAPVRPEQGMNLTSFAGLNPTFFKYGTSLSLHSSYLEKVKHVKHCHETVQWPKFKSSFVPCFVPTNCRIVHFVD